MRLIFQRKIRVNISFGVAEIISHFQLKKGGWEGEGGMENDERDRGGGVYGCEHFVG